MKLFQKIIYYVLFFFGFSTLFIMGEHLLGVSDVLNNQSTGFYGGAIWMALFSVAREIFQEKIIDKIK